MLGWLDRNVDLLNLFVSTGMFLIWILYLQLFYRSYRLQRRPILFIHQAYGFDLDSLCMIANLSESNVHVASIIVDGARGGESVSFLPPPNSPDPLEEDEPVRQLHQGPLPQGGYFIVTRFRSLVAEAEERLAHASGELTDLRLTIRVVAFVGSQLRPAGARRSFDVQERAAGIEIRPVELTPQQLSARRQRAVVQEWLEEARRMDRTQMSSYDDDQKYVERLKDLLEERSRVKDPRAPEEPKGRA